VKMYIRYAYRNILWEEGCQKMDIFDVLLTMHLSITLDNDQFNAQIFNAFITILYMYAF